MRPLSLASSVAWVLVRTVPTTSSDTICRLFSAVATRTCATARSLRTGLACSPLLPQLTANTRTAVHTKEPMTSLNFIGFEIWRERPRVGAAQALSAEPRPRSADLLRLRPGEHAPSPAPFPHR